jgi:CheY-like chemotaxis protein
MNAYRLLHVEDEPDIREVVEMSLALDPAIVLKSCASGADALVTAAAWEPDVILMDVMMPGMDGPTTFRKMQQNPDIAGIPVLLLTAKVQGVDQRRFADLGVAGVLFKPFDPLTLAAQISAALGWKD